MAVALFYRQVESYLSAAVFIFAMVLMAWAFIHAAIQRADAFAAVSQFRKNAWLGILGGLFIGSILFNVVGLVIVMYIGIAAAAYYLLEVRRGIKDAAEGPW